MDGYSRLPLRMLEELSQKQQSHSQRLFGWCTAIDIAEDFGRAYLRESHSNRKWFMLSREIHAIARVIGVAARIRKAENPGSGGAHELCSTPLQ